MIAFSSFCILLNQLPSTRQSAIKKPGAHSLHTHHLDMLCHGVTSLWWHQSTPTPPPTLFKFNNNLKVENALGSSLIDWSDLLRVVTRLFLICHSFQQNKKKKYCGDWAWESLMAKSMIGVRMPRSVCFWLPRLSTINSIKVNAWNKRWS